MALKMNAYSRSRGGTHRRHWRAATLVLAAAGALVATAPLASAKSTLDQDGVRLTEAGFDFGDNTFADGAPTGNGTLTWVLQNGALTPRLKGTLHLRNVDNVCARMRMDFYNGNALLKRKRGGTVCAPDSAHHSYAVDLRPYTDIRITKVIVVIESQTSFGQWLPAVSDTYWRTLADDAVAIDGDGFDLGGADLIDDAPTDSATVDWKIADGALTANVSGFLHINHNAGACAQVQVRSFTGNANGHEGRSVGVVYSQLHCAPDNGDAPAYFSVDLAPSTEPVEALQVRLIHFPLTGDMVNEGERFVYVSKDF